MAVKDPTVVAAPNKDPTVVAAPDKDPTIVAAPDKPTPRDSSEVAVQPGEESEEDTLDSEGPCDFDLNPADLKKIIRARIEKGGFPKDLGMSQALYAVVEHVKKCTPKFHGDTNNIMDSKRSFANQKKSLGGTETFPVDPLVSPYRKMLG